MLPWTGGDGAHQMMFRTKSCTSDDRTKFCFNVRQVMQSPLSGPRDESGYFFSWMSFA